MRIPKTIIVCGHKINIKYRKNITYGGSECWGLWDESTHTITLRYGMNLSQRSEILLHEILHAIESIHVLNNLNEKTIKILGVEILAAIKNNKLKF